MHKQTSVYKILRVNGYKLLYNDHYLEQGRLHWTVTRYGKKIIIVLNNRFLFPNEKA